MTSHTDKVSAGNGHAAYMIEYRKRKRSEEDNCNNVPKWTKVNAERQCEYRETRKNLSAEEMQSSSKSSGKQNITSIYVNWLYTNPNYNQANEYFQKNFIGNPFGYACDICDRLWYMNDLNQCTVNIVMFQ
jgi:hypothetical protein